MSRILTAEETKAAALSTEAGITITCGACGQVSGWAGWYQTPICGELPPGQLQCPQCRRAWRRARVIDYHDHQGKWCNTPFEMIPIPTAL